MCAERACHGAIVRSENFWGAFEERACGGVLADPAESCPIPIVRE